MIPIEELIIVFDEKGDGSSEGARAKRIWKDMEWNTL
jgi:hypothetical protein